MSHSNPYRTMMEYLDNLVKSRFIEMFGPIDLSAQLESWVKIGDLGKILTGSTPKTNVDEYWDGDIKWIAPAELTKDSFFVYDTERKITEAGRDSCSLNMLTPGTVLLSSRAPIGKVAIVGSEMYCNQGFKNIECGPDLNNIFLYTILKNNSNFLNSLGRGATFKEISAKIVENIIIPAPVIEQQNQFAEFVQQVDKSKAIVQKCIDKYDQLVKSRFIEMFGDPYVSPKFESVPFLECMIFNPVKSEIKNMNDSTEVSFVPMEFVGTDGSINTESVKTLGEVRKGYTYFREGDVVFAKITPCFENGKVAIAEGCKNGIGFGTTEFHVVRPIKGISNNIWLKYLLKSDSLRHLASSNMSGTAGQKRVQLPFFEKIKIGLPPIDLQEQFAIFVQQVDKSKFKSEE